MTTADEIKSQITNNEQQLDILRSKLFRMQSDELESIESEWRPGENDARTLAKIEALQQSAAVYGIAIYCWEFKEHLLCNFVDEGGAA